MYQTLELQVKKDWSSRRKSELLKSKTLVTRASKAFSAGT